MASKNPERSLLVPLKLLRQGPLRWSASVRAADLTGPDRAEDLHIADVEVPLDSEVEVELSLELISDGMSAVGHVSAGWRGPCARCWTPLEGQASVNVREVFAPEPREGEQYRLGVEHADLAPMVREAILLELPIEAIACPYPDPCPNLPAELNANRDDSVHSEMADPADQFAPAELVDPRWAPLEALRRDRDEPS